MFILRAYHDNHRSQSLCKETSQRARRVGAGASTGFRDMSSSEHKHADCIPYSRWQSIGEADKFVCHTCYTKDGLAAAMPRGHGNFVMGVGMPWPKPETPSQNTRPTSKRKHSGQPTTQSEPDSSNISAPDNSGSRTTILRNSSGLNRSAICFVYCSKPVRTRRDQSPPSHS